MLNALVALHRIVWRKTYRIIRSIYPPVDLFEDIAHPSRWESLERFSFIRIHIPRL